MNKADIVAHVSVSAGVSKRVAAIAVDAVLDGVKRAVAKGEKVALPGFGSFEKRLRAPRTARNPQTGERIKIPATSVPVFRAGKEFKEAVGGKRKRASR